MWWRWRWRWLVAAAGVLVMTGAPEAHRNRLLAARSDVEWQRCLFQGVCCERLTEAVLKWQGTGLIRGVRGRLSVLDRPGLEPRSCACYAEVKQADDRLLADRTAL